MEKKYYVTYADKTDVLTAEEFKNFINIAVIHNKDISKFSVEYK